MARDKRNDKRKQNSKRKSRCKYWYRFGHSDQKYPGKMHKRPLSMPEWINRMTCAKYKKKWYFSFNCPPTYNNKIRKIQQKKSSSSHNSEDNNPK